MRFLNPVVVIAVLAAAPALALEASEVTEGVSFVPGKGVSFDSKDGRFRLRMRPRIQMLLTLEQPDQERMTQSFQLRRARLAFSGHMFDPKLGFKMELSVSPRDLATKNGAPQRPPFLDWVVTSTHLRDLSVRAGQFKVKYSRQRVWSSGNLQMVDRSLAQAEFNLDRDIGFELFSDDLFDLDMLRYYFFVGAGEGRDNFLGSDFGLLYVGRIEIQPFGDFDDSKSVDFKRRRNFDLSIGLAYAFADDARRARVTRSSAFADGGTDDQHNVTADAVIKWAGFSFISEVYLRASSDRVAGDVDVDLELTRQGYGGFVQGGYLLPVAPVEVSARYSAVRPFGESSLSAQNELGAGVSWYLYEHTYKIQADLFRIYGDDVGAGDTRFRAQIQAAF